MLNIKLNAQFLFFCYSDTGPPQLDYLNIAPNVTSSTVTLICNIGSDGGHAPQTITISMRKHGNNEAFTVITVLSAEHMNPQQSSGELDVYYIVKGLKPSTKYDFQVTAMNRRKDKFPDKVDTSEPLMEEAETKG